MGFPVGCYRITSFNTLKIIDTINFSTSVHQGHQAHSIAIKCPINNNYLLVVHKVDPYM